MRTSKADLHIHTCYSADGEMAPAWIAQRCAERGIGVFTITDHNTVAGAREMSGVIASGELGYVPHYIPGIEIDCVFEGIDMHLLGYGIDIHSRDFDTLEERVNRLSTEAFDEMADNLLKLGFPVDKTRVLELAGNRIPTGELMVETMLVEENSGCPLLKPYFEGGDRSDMPFLNFYLDWFLQGKPAYVRIEWISFAEAVALIRDNGGMPVVAHPGLNFGAEEDSAVRLLTQGAAGLECFNNYHTPEQADYFARLVTGSDAVMTCGSDYHGKIKPGIELGIYSDPGIYKSYFEGAVARLCGGTDAI